MKTQSQKSRSRTRSTILFLILAVSLVLQSVQAAPGDLDTTFNAPNGFTLFDNFFFSDIAIQPGTGKTLAVGYRKIPIDINQNTLIFIIARFNLDGTLDSSFGTNGIVEGPEGSFWTRIAFQNEKIIVVGGKQGASPQVLVGRFEANGQVDMSFGQNGFAMHDSSTAGNVGMAIGPDGTIVLLGVALPEDGQAKFGLARLTTNGELDMTFGTGGKVLANGVAFDIAVLGDGRILAAGTVNSQGFAAWRFTSSGMLDMPFGGGDGVGTVALPAGSVAFALAVQTDGRIVLAGVADQHDGQPPAVGALARFDSNGNVDASFNGGTVTLAIPGVEAFFLDLAIQSDGAIVAVGGTSQSQSVFHTLVSRYTSGGALDPSFGSGGTVTTDFPGEKDARAVTIQTDGKIVIAGDDINVDQPSALVARYNGNGAPPPPPPPPPPSFNICIQNGSLIFKFNSTTGAYEFRDCAKNLTLTGTGTVSTQFCKLFLNDKGPNKPSDRNVAVTVNTCTRVASVAITIVSPAKSYSFTDNDVTQGSCTCP